MLSWLIIADDLTGACDSGAAFAKRGYSTRVAFGADEDFSEAAVAVWVTDSRPLPAAQAVLAVKKAAERLPGLGSPRVYQKIDSTLRGHPGPEFAALLAEMGVERALVCPAFPEQGRLVRAGKVLVHGTPLESTDFADGSPPQELAWIFDTGPGSRSIHRTEVRRGVDWLAERIAEPGVYTADAETAADLECLARAGLQAGIRLFCGSAGLARALAAQMAPGAASTETPHANGPLLAVAGSRSQATLEQVAALAGAGWENLYPLEHDLTVPAATSPLGFQAAKILSAGSPVALSIARLAHLAGGEEQIAAWLADVAAAVARQAPLGGLILTGGATARAVLQALDCKAIQLRGEVQPGVVCGLLRGGGWSGLPLVTKAGGFGGPDALVRAAAHLHATV